MGGSGGGQPPSPPALPEPPELPEPAHNPSARFTVDSKGLVSDATPSSRSALDIAANADVSTAPNEAFFWSGVAMEEAGALARSMGGTTLEDLLTARGIDMPKFTTEDPDIAEAWYLVSARYAAQASGLTRGIINPIVMDNPTVWNLLERPTLINNPLVTRIGIINPEFP
jgi:hypothetical protein